MALNNRAVQELVTGLRELANGNFPGGDVPGEEVKASVREIATRTLRLADERQRAAERAADEYAEELGAELGITPHSGEDR